MGEVTKGIRAEIYRAQGFRCANGGLSDTEISQVTVVGPGIDEVFSAGPDAPAVRLVKRVIGGQEITHAEPVDQPDGMVGPMMGGAYIGSSDSRLTRAFGIYGAVALHDRFETPAQYASYD